MAGRHRRDGGASVDIGSFPWSGVGLDGSRLRRRGGRHSKEDSGLEGNLTTGVMFICTGNIVRSAYAELKSGELTQRPMAFSSRGVRAVLSQNLHPQMKNHILYPANHVSQQATAQALRNSCLILAMERAHLEWIAEEAPDAAGRAFLLTHVAATLEKTPPAVPLHPVELAAYLKTIHVKVPDKPDVDDPIYGTAEDFAQCAGRLDTLLHSILPWLSLGTWS